MSWLMSIIRRILMVMDSTKTKLQFLHGVVDMFKDILVSIHYLTETGKHPKFILLSDVGLLKLHLNLPNSGFKLYTFLDENATEYQMMVDAVCAFTKEVLILSCKEFVVSH
jgi:hypothetical protein